MKKIRTASGGLLFLEGKDYMPKLLAYLRETAGNDAAETVEEWAREQTAEMAEALLHVSNKARDAEERERIAELKTHRIFDELRDERDEHLEEITELEEELVRVAELKDMLMASNQVLIDLVNHPEKLFPEIGTSVYRERKGKAREYGSIDAYKLRMHGAQPTFFLRATFRTDDGWAESVWYKFANLGKTIHTCAEEPAG